MQYRAEHAPSIAFPVLSNASALSIRVLEMPVLLTPLQHHSLRLHTTDNLVVSSSIASVTNDLHSAEHLTDSEETENLSSDNSGRGNLCAAGVADGGDWGLAENGGWVADQLLVELLEGSNWSASLLVSSF